MRRLQLRQAISEPLADGLKECLRIRGFLGAPGVRLWGESKVENLDRYIYFLMTWTIVSQKVPTSDLVTNDLIDDINSFDAGKIEAVAKDGADSMRRLTWPVRGRAVDLSVPVARRIAISQGSSATLLNNSLLPVMPMM